MIVPENKGRNRQLRSVAVKRSKVSLTDFTDVEGMQPPHFASAYTAASPLNNDLLVTLSANPSVTKHEPEVYARNRDY